MLLPRQEHVLAREEHGFDRPYPFLLFLFRNVCVEAFEDLLDKPPVFPVERVNEPRQLQSRLWICTKPTVGMHPLADPIDLRLNHCLALVDTFGRGFAGGMPQVGPTG